jgi:hypothetical protein
MKAQSQTRLFLLLLAFGGGVLLAQAILELMTLLPQPPECWIKGLCHYTIYLLSSKTQACTQILMSCSVSNVSLDDFFHGI